MGLTWKLSPLEMLANVLDCWFMFKRKGGRFCNGIFWEVDLYCKLILVSHKKYVIINKILLLLDCKLHEYRDSLGILTITHPSLPAWDLPSLSSPISCPFSLNCSLATMSFFSSWNSTLFLSVSEL